jgi:hypothetical protein
MAGVAVTGGKGLMLGQILCSLQHSVVALRAQLGSLRIEQLCGPGMGLVASATAAIGDRRVQHRQTRSCPDFRMTVAAQFALRGHQERLPSSTVRPMTSKTVVCGRRMDDGLAGLTGIVVTGRAKLHRLGQQQSGKVALMAPVTLGAVLGHRMGRRRRQRFFDVGVTARAEVFLGRDQQGLVVGGVRIVALEAIPSRGGSMDRDRAARFRFVVTVETNRFAARRRLGSLSVAYGTVGFGMDRGSQQARARGRVRRMTASAVGALDRQASMTLGEGPVRFVARAAQLVPADGEKSGLGRPVGLVTASAALSEGSMQLGTLESGTLVTLQAEVALPMGEEGRMLGSVWIVTARASVDLGMPMVCLKSERVLRMAVEAELGFRLRESQRPDQAVGLMAGVAAALGQGSVAVARCLHDLYMTVEAAAAAIETAPCLQLGFAAVRAQPQADGHQDREPSETEHTMSLHLMGLQNSVGAQRPP